MNEKRIDCIKKDIRSVLLTAKNGLSLEDFRRAYKNLVGVRLPSREFGYTLDIDFLYSVPDVVHIKVESDGNYHLCVIADETTEHIQKLVSRQRDPKRTSNKRNYIKSSNFSPHIMPVPKGTNKGRPFMPAPKCTNKDQPFMPAPKNTNKGRPFVPAKLRGEVINLVREYPDGIGFTCLRNTYQNIYKKKLNMAWLSHVPEEQFRNLVDIVPELDIRIVNNQEKIFYLNHQNNVISDTRTIDSNCESKHLKVFRSSNNSASSTYQENHKNLHSSVIPENVKYRFEQNSEKDVLLSSNHAMEKQSIHQEVFTVDVKHSQTSHSSSLLDESMESKFQTKNGLDLPNSHLKKKRRYVKKIALGDGYSMNIVVVNDKAYVSNGDVYNLFWEDFDPQYMDTEFDSQNEAKIQRTLILDTEFPEVFYQCERYSVKGIDKTGNGNSLALYSLKDIIKVLNIFGHPSARIRDRIYEEIKIFNPHDKLWEEYDEENLKEVAQDSICNGLCLHDLRSKQTRLFNHKIQLRKYFQQNRISHYFYMLKVEECDLELNNIQEEIDIIESICSKYENLSLY